MLKAKLDARFPYGVLLITDSTSIEPIPSWATPDEQVAVADTAFVIRVLHGDEGEVAVRVWDSESDAHGGLSFSGETDLPSGALRVSDAMGGVAAEADIGAGRRSVSIFADSNVEASAVHLVLA
jgi:hypothetical protein